MPRIKVKCDGCGCRYERFISESYHPKTNFCTRDCRSAHRRISLNVFQENVYSVIRSNPGISTYEMVKILRTDYSRIRKAAEKLWKLGLVGRLYNTWSTDKEEEAVEEWNR
jgi:hypothetical protein